MEASGCREVVPGETRPVTVRAIHEAADDVLWAGALEALYRGVPTDSGFHWQTFSIGREGLPAPVSSIVETRAGALGFGTLGAGVLLWRDRSCARLGTSSLLARSRVRHLYEDASGVLWVGTEDAGLCRSELPTIGRQDPSLALVQCFGKAEGLFDEGIHSVVEDRRGRLWMSTNRGIFWVPRNDLNELARGERHSVGSIVLDERDGWRGPESFCNTASKPSHKWRPPSASAGPTSPDCTARATACRPRRHAHKSEAAAPTPRRSGGPDGLPPAHARERLRLYSTRQTSQKDPEQPWAGA